VAGDEVALSQSPRLHEDNIDQHHRILVAIEARDAAAARHAMADHIRAAGDFVARLLESTPASASGTWFGL
jgi:DNA-binding GntR family transcriptional regulator